MSERFTVSLDDDNAEWVDDEHRDRDRSKAWVVNEAIRAARGEDSTFAVHIGEQHTGEHRTTPVSGDGVDELEQRLDDVEARLSALEGRSHERGHASETEATRDDVSPSAQQESLRQPSSGSQHTPDAGGSSSVDESTDSLRAEAEEAVEAAEVPGRAAAVERVRREALLWAWEYLREHEHCRSSEIANATFGAFWDERHLKYSTSGRYPGYGQWDGYLRDCLKKLPGVQPPGPRGKDWFFDDQPS